MFSCASLSPVVLLGYLGLALAHERIDRHQVVSKYSVVRSSLIDNNTTPLQVGNGNFAFSVDNTGMQSYDSEKLSDYKGIPMVTHGRNVSYDIPDPNLPKTSQWLISNPNRINLGRIGLKYQNVTLSSTQITEPRQTLDLWNGVITSTFKIDNQPVKVITQGDFSSDSVAFSIDSSLVATGALEVELDFPYPPIHTVNYKFEVFAGVYDFFSNHTTSIVDGKRGSGTAQIYHELQATNYFVNLRWPFTSPLKLAKNDPSKSNEVTAHRFTLSAEPQARHKSRKIEFTANFAPDSRKAALPSTVQRRNPGHWHEYWNEGGFVDLTSSTNPKANELQRRIILSQYIVRVNSAAKGQSPQESGLMNNGWYGKFHMEMVVWHNAHWATWGKQKYFDNIFPELYEKLLPSSLARAKKMGWEGARWPKMTEINTGASSPGGINGLLLWQQPHTMYMAKLAYQAKPTRDTLLRWAPVIEAAADYMASYAWKNESSGNYDLGPPSYGVTENTPPRETLNLAYELAYWRYGLDAARDWFIKLGKPYPEKWTTVAENLAPLPQLDGLYTVYEGLNSTWWDDPELNGDPRSLIMLRGVLPDTPAVDAQIALKTADKIAEFWTGVKIRGWGRPVLAINSAKIGRPDRAIAHLTAYEFFHFDDAGFAYRGGDGKTPPPFLPGNAGFLWAVSYMAAGWHGSHGDAPGFPKDGTWVVRQEGLRKSL